VFISIAHGDSLADSEHVPLRGTGLYQAFATIAARPNPAVLKALFGVIEPSRIEEMIRAKP
jgi:hypothetical protein